MKVFGMILMVLGGGYSLWIVVVYGVGNVPGILLFIGGTVLYGSGRIVEVLSPTSGSITPRVQDGPVETFYDNGQLEVKGTRKDGDWDGPYETYYENGQLSEKVTYKDGERDGPRERYNENGQLGSKGTYKDGEKCGEWLDFGETVTYDPCPPGGN